MRQRLESWADYFGGIGLALLVITGIFYLLKQSQERLIILGVLGAIFLALYVYARPQQVRRSVTSRGAIFGSNALLVIVAFIGLIALLNWLSSNRWNGHYDLTANKSNSLSELTVKVLQDLKEPVRATAFYTTLRPDNQTLSDAQDRLKEYARQSDKFTYRFVDPQAEPQIANDYKVQFDGTIVMERGSRRENALSSDEQALTNAVLKVAQDKQAIIYFTTGHGEHGIDDTSENGYSNIKAPLEGLNFKFDTINLRTITDTLPSDITTLVIAGPKQKFDPAEVKSVKDYLDKNGRALIMIDPQTDTGLDSIIKEWGITPRNDVVFDPSSAISGRPQLLIIQSYKNHQTTQYLQGIALFLPNTRSLMTTTPTPSGRSASALFSSSPNSWGETDFDSIKNQNPKFDANVDTKGPLDLAYAAESFGKDTPGRLIVIGNSSFITNGTLRAIQGGVANGDFLVGLLNWLAGQENLIAIPPKPADSHPLLMNADQSNFVFLSSFLFLPGVVLLLGAIVWWRRR